jgi:hypothetical protein
VIPIGIEKRLILRAIKRIPLEKPRDGVLGKPSRTKGHKIMIGKKNLVIAIPPSFEKK